MRRLLVPVALAVGLGALLALGAVPCGLLAAQPRCRVALLPGPATNALDVIRLDGAEATASDGELLLTTVRVDTALDWRDWLRVAVSSRAQDVPRSTVLPPGASLDEVTGRNAALMDDSQQQATLAALRAAGYDVGVRSRGARVLHVLQDGAAAGRLEVDDVLVAVDGRRVREPSDVVAAVRRRVPGDDVAVDVRGQDGGRRRERIRLAADPDDPERAVLGVILGADLDLPVDVRFETGVIGGPSAGLMFTLGVVDLLDPEDLTGGRVVAGTGTIAADGAVSAVSSAALKVLGAVDREDGGPPAEVFLVPATNLDEAAGAPVDRPLLLAPVDDLDDALDALRRLRDGAPVPGAITIGEDGGGGDGAAAPPR